MLLAMTMLVSIVTYGDGRSNMMFGLVHLVVFAMYVFMVLVP